MSGYQTIILLIQTNENVCVYFVLKNLFNIIPYFPINADIPNRLWST